MSRIDTTKIDGWDSMTAEQKIEALTSYEYDDGTKEIDSLKQLVSKANGEASNYKKMYQTKLTEQEKKELELKEAQQKRDEELNAMKEQLEAYKQKEQVSTYTQKLMGVGYDQETATKLAQTLPSGISDDFFASTKTFLEAQRKSYEKQTLEKQPQPTTGNPPSPNEVVDKDMEAFKRGAGL